MNTSAGVIPAYYAFDDRTNLMPGANAASYPPTGAQGYWDNAPVGTHPGNRETRDGASWISVPVGELAEVEIHLDKNNAACLENCTFRVDSSRVATAVTTSVSSRRAAFLIRGVNDGEATLIARCNGQDIGWFHIWCKPWVTLDLDCYLATYPGSSSPTQPIDQGAMETFLNKVFRQVLISFNVTWSQLILPASALAIEAQARIDATTVTMVDSNRRPTRAPDMHLSSHAVLVNYLNAVIPASSRTRSRNGYIFHKPRSAREVTVGANGNAATSFAGVVPTVGMRVGWSVSNRTTTFAHEVGHMLGLGHPFTLPGQRPTHGLPSHLIASLGQPVPNRAATNTEGRIRGNALAGPTGDFNVMALDPNNLMCYPRKRSGMEFLRLGQWEKCRRN
ncbi:M12 family metallo-peptidase [Pseudaestuariivita rosea]|uniref:M12 family metallo-peptidase n=1 Tax=Pseudaestuariivita rosea TaxID=2763263 RepID=UPI001ABAB12A|nr:M12 family metallo-peptidase [Pseudaestuariivita rosea]